MTRIRLDLSDYDFTVIYKKGKMNTNADALSRIEINSVVKTNDTIREKDKATKILTTTRELKKKNKEASKMNSKNNTVGIDNYLESCSSQKSDYLQIWECTSIRDVKDMKKLKFYDIENVKRDNIFIENNIVHIGRDNNSTKPVSIVKKSRIKRNENNVNTKISDKSAKLDSILRKLILKMKENNICELALADDDEIFKWYTKKELKEAYAKIRIHYERPQLKILIYNAPIRINDDILKYKLIDEFHSATHAGHLGIRKTIIKLKQRYIWKNMNKMVKQFVSHCDVCSRNKQTKHTKEPLMLTNTPGNSFEVISIDTVGTLRISNDYRYILTMQCELTKFVVAHPMPTKDAPTTAKTLEP